MTTRTREDVVTFSRPFSLASVGRILPPGAYRVITDEELIEGLSFPVYRRVATMMMIPARQRSSTEMIAIDPGELDAARSRDDKPGSATP